MDGPEREKFKQSRVDWSNKSIGICLVAILLPAHCRRASTCFLIFLLNIVYFFTVLQFFTANVHTVANMYSDEMTNVVIVCAWTMLNLGSVFQYYCYQKTSIDGTKTWEVCVVTWFSVLWIQMSPLSDNFDLSIMIDMSEVFLQDAYYIVVLICSLYFRGLFIIDDKGVLRQITMNDLPVSTVLNFILLLAKVIIYIMYSLP